MADTEAPRLAETPASPQDDTSICEQPAGGDEDAGVAIATIQADESDSAAEVLDTYGDDRSDVASDEPAHSYQPISNENSEMGPDSTSATGIDNVLDSPSITREDTLDAKESPYENAGIDASNLTNIQVYEEQETVLAAGTDPSNEQPSANLETVEAPEGPGTSALPKTLTGKRLMVSTAQNAAQMLTTANGKTTNHTKAQTALYRNTTSYRWKLVATGINAPDGSPYYYVMRWGTSQVLHVDKGGTTNGTAVKLYRKNGSSSQLWAVRLVDGSDRIATLISSLSYRRNLGYELVLDLKGGSGASKTNLVVRCNRDLDRQHFVLLRSSQDLLQDGYYHISSSTKPTLALAVKGASTRSGAPLILAKATQTIAQTFLVHLRTDGSCRIQTAASGGWLTGTSTGKALVQQGSPSSKATKAQLWRMYWAAGTFWALRNVKTGLVLDLAGNKLSSGTTIVSNAASDTKSQRFTFSTCDLVPEGVYTLTSTYDTRLSVDPRRVKTPGANVAVQKASSSRAQRFVFRKRDNGYQIYNAASGLALSVTRTMEDGSNVSQRRTHYGSSQIWDISIAAGGRLCLTNRASGLVLAVTGSEAGSNVIQHARSISPQAVRWKLTRNSANDIQPPAQPQVRVLMIGNSFTYRTGTDYNNNLPTQLATLLSSSQTCEVVRYSQQGKDLEYLIEKNGGELLQLPYLGDGADWDFVIIQGQSTTPIDKTRDYLTQVQTLSDAARISGATSVLYATWAFRGTPDNGGTLERGISLENMHNALQVAFAEAAYRTGAALANVGQAFADAGFDESLYAPDDAKHLASAGIELAAQVIAATLQALLS